MCYTSLDGSNMSPKPLGLGFLSKPVHPINRNLTIFYLTLLSLVSFFAPGSLRKHVLSLYFKIFHYLFIFKSLRRACPWISWFSIWICAATM